MSLFSEKCDRCGAKTRHKHDDKPICESCEQEMALVLEATKETARLCPLDGQIMSKEIAHMIVIDRCPSCHGVWLDGGELDKISEDVTTRAVMAMTSCFNVPFS